MKEYIFFGVIFILLLGWMFYDIQYNKDGSYGDDGIPDDGTPLFVGYGYSDKDGMKNYATAGTPQECKTMCDNDPNCSHYTFDSSANGNNLFDGNLPCFLFDNTPGNLEICFDCVSGAKKTKLLN